MLLLIMTSVTSFWVAILASGIVSAINLFGEDRSPSSGFIFATLGAGFLVLAMALFLINWFRSSSKIRDILDSRDAQRE